MYDIYLPTYKMYHVPLKKNQPLQCRQTIPGCRGSVMVLIPLVKTKSFSVKGGVWILLISRASKHLLTAPSGANVATPPCPQLET